MPGKTLYEYISVKGTFEKPTTHYYPQPMGESSKATFISTNLAADESSSPTFCSTELPE